MPWDLKTQYVHDAIGMHVMLLENKDTDAQHLLQILLAADSCPHCGHVTPKNNLHELQPRVHLMNELALLNQSHKNIESYKQNHGVKSLVIPREKKLLK